jgi:hypothetical protein
MSWETVHNTVRFMIHEIKAQIDDNVTGHKENDNKIHFHFPPGADLRKIKDIEIDRQTEDLIVAGVMEELKSKRPLIVSMDEKDLLQILGNATAASMCEIAKTK